MPSLDITSTKTYVMWGRRYQDGIDEANETQEPLVITGKRGNAVLISEEDWMAVQETLHLLSTPGMRESIREGMTEPVDERSEEPGW